jgi:tetratricopeptide (TPR) repeat protein
LSDHPSRADLRRFVRGELGADASKPVVAHLVRRCKVCLAQLGPSLRALLDGSGPAAGRSTIAAARGRADSEYDPAIDRAFASVTLHGLRALSTRAETRRIKAAMALGGPRLARQIEEWGARYAVYEALLERSWEARFDDLRLMIELTRWACRVASRLGGEGYGDLQVADFEARAWGEHANALRAAHRLAKARAALELAAEHAARGTQEPRLRVRLIEIRASLLANRRRYDEAIVLLEESYRGYLELGDRRGAATALVTRATYTGHAGRLELSARLLDEAIGLLGEGADPALLGMAIFNRIWLLADAGEFRQARTLLWKNRHWMESCQDMGRINRAKLVWLEGHINAGLGELERAERILRQAIEVLPQDELPVLRCQLSLELAAIWMQQGRWEEALRLAAEGAQGLRVLNLPREGEKALGVLREALERQTASLGLVRSVIRFLRRSQVMARVRFELHPD